ncbi:tetratricopeptide repeat protein [Gracilibacillus massiliensis]|uniref:tetratricopeptide repeat protein n=1 Tax=Gracilibacillus massiliensis TaxID=1564956 RepID=UPI00071DAC7C|nr:tetratricopeptide repeat protein [Gracilibacillus massiliensis]
MGEQNLYEVLGVDENGSQTDIKRAYYRQIRIYTNEKHPEKFQELNQAYETLFDEGKRQEYDRMIQDGGRYETAANQVVEHINNQNYYRAAQLLEEMLQDYPDDPTVKFKLADVYISLERFQDAKRLGADLILEDPNSEEYRLLMRQIYFHLGDAYKEEVQLKKLIQLNLNERNYHLLLSHLYTERDQYDESIRVIEEGLLVTPNGIEDYFLLSELYFLAFLNQDEFLRKNTLKKMRQLPNNEEEKQQVMAFIMNNCDNVDQNHPALPDLVRLVEKMNHPSYDEVEDWLNERQHLLNNNQEHQPSNYQEEVTEDLRGSILGSIIVGIIFSFIATPIVGIIVGFVYYFYAERIKQILGCLILIIIAVAVIALFLSGL